MVDLSRWNLTTPEVDPDTGLAKTYPTSELPTLVNDYFIRTPSGAITFYAPVLGGVTANTDRTRCELRETNPDGSQFNWYGPNGDHFLRAALTVFEAPSSGVTVVGQIHTKLGSNPLIKLKWKRGFLAASVRFHPDEAPVDTNLLQTPLGARFTYSIHLTPRGNLSVSASCNSVSVNKAFPISSAWMYAPLYFKAGVYNQDGEQDFPGECSDATFYRLEVEH